MGIGFRDVTSDVTHVYCCFVAHKKSKTVKFLWVRGAMSKSVDIELIIKTKWLDKDSFILALLQFTKKIIIQEYSKK